MGISVGARLGPYEITGALGVGGMGEVYRARDLQLGREVAIKVVSDSLIFDAERLARFKREAQVLASLNHPNIAAIYGLEHTGDRQALVLELVDGMTLAERLARAPLPIDDALAIARQLAEALEAAHERGIVHRDLKPANVMLTPTGVAKVLDFGISTSTSLHTDAAGTTVVGTMPGTIIGTAHYMSPEQALGKSADQSTDVWAFGCVLYEMLAGRPAFPGETAGEVLANVLKADPDWSALPAGTPEGIRRLLRRALQKKATQRLRDIRSARLEVDDILARTAPAEDTPVPARRSSRVAWAVAAAAALGCIAFGVAALRQPAAAPEVRLEINTPPSRDPFTALSPDGRRIVFAATTDSQKHLWLRSLDSTTSIRLPGTEGGTNPFWSADGRSIGFFAGSLLMRLDVEGQAATPIGTAEVPLGGTWNADDVIVFGSRPRLPLSRVAASGGDSAPVTMLQPGHDSHATPAFLPDGQHFIFYVVGSPEARGVYLGHLDRPATRRLFVADTPAVYTRTGHLLFVREGRLLAQRFDAERLEIVGEPFAIADGMGGGAHITASRGGPIAYRTTAPDSGLRQLVWMDRGGTELDRVSYPDTAALGPALTPDGRHVGVFRFQSANMDLWSYDRARRIWDRITVGVEHEIYALWSADGARLVFASSRSGPLNIYSKPTSAPPGQGEEVLVATPDAKWPMDLRRDGQFLLFTSLSEHTRADIWAVSLVGEDRAPFEVVKTEFVEQLPQFSPDGEWIAYQSDRTGRFEIYLRRFRGTGNDIRVSTNGGGQPRWSHSGDEIYYVAADDWLTAVPVRRGAADALEPGNPEQLFPTGIGSTAPNTNRHQYAVAPDGTFVLNGVVGDAGASPITVILNWAPGSSR